MEILTNPHSEYNKIYKAYKEDYQAKTAHLIDEDDFITHDFDYDFTNWSDEIINKLKNILKNEILKCNKELIFFRGCNFKNYKHNYKSNLSFFLTNHEDATEYDFIKNEIIYYKKTLNDIQITLYSKKYYPIDLLNSLKYLFKIIEVIGYNQFEISTNKILDFLNNLEIKFKTKSKSITGAKEDKNDLNENTINKIDVRIDLWLQKYKDKIDYTSFPKGIEEKKIWVEDNYNNYEERYYKYQIDICNVIVNDFPNKNEIIIVKNEFKDKLITLRKINPIPEVEISKITMEINNAFYKLERYMKGIDLEYNSFYFNDKFTILFNEMKKLENKNKNNDFLINQYYDVISQIYYDYDKSDFLNTDAYDNEDFNRDCNEIIHLALDRLDEFCDSQTQEEIETQNRKKSITDLMKTSFKKDNNIPNEENPYPRIFKDYYSYSIFKKLYDVFGKDKECLSNYSYVFYKMTYEGLIHFDLLHKTYIEMLSNFDIYIDRIKPKADIGKIALRDSIYSKVK